MIFTRTHYQQRINNGQKRQATDKKSMYILHVMTVFGRFVDVKFLTLTYLHLAFPSQIHSLRNDFCCENVITTTLYYGGLLVFTVIQNGDVIILHQANNI